MPQHEWLSSPPPALSQPCHPPPPPPPLADEQLLQWVERTLEDHRGMLPKLAFVPHITHSGFILPGACTCARGGHRRGSRDWGGFGHQPKTKL